MPIIVGIVLLLILLICVFVFAGDLFGNGNSTESSLTTTTTQTTAVSEASTETTTEAAGDSIMPDLLGKNFENQKTQYASWITFDVEEVYSDEYSAGQICWQEYKAGDTFDSSHAVKIQVSKGSATVEVPSYSGYGLSSYTADLDELNIPYNTVAEVNSGYSNGSIIRISATRNGKDVNIAAGDSINLNDGYQLTVYYANNPVPETTAPPVTEAPAATTAAQTEPPATDAPPAATTAADLGV